MIVVTGADGRLGNALVDGLARSFSMVCPRTKEQLDITNIESIRECFAEFRPESVINCAAFTHVDGAELCPDIAYEVNHQAVENLALFCRQFRAHLVHISTDYVLKHTGLPHAEEDDTITEGGVYALSKLAGEIKALRFGATVIRLQWLYSAHDESFMNRTLRTMKLKGDGKTSPRLVIDQIGVPTPVSSIIGPIIEMARKEPGGLWHLAPHDECSSWDWVKLAAERKKVEFEARPITKDQLPGGKLRPAHSVLDPTDIEHYLGFTMPTWKDALKIELG